MTQQTAAASSLAPEAILLRYESLRARGNWTAAREALNRADSSDPDHLDVLRARCQFHFEQAEWPQAEVAMRRLCEREPADGAALHNLGAVLIQLNRPMEAASTLRASWRVRPELEHTKQLLKKVLIRLGQTSDEASELARAS